jgi:hypothetical protein
LPLLNCCLRIFAEKDPEQNVPVVVCGVFNGGVESGAVRFLEDRFVDESLREDGEPVSSGRKDLPFSNALTDIVASVEGREPPPTLVVPELIALLVEGGNGAYEMPRLANDRIERLKRICDRQSTGKDNFGASVMNVDDVQQGYLVTINKKLGRGSEFREAA